MRPLQQAQRAKLSLKSWETRGALLMTLLSAAAVKVFAEAEAAGICEAH
jgi:hypothetical protein